MCTNYKVEYDNEDVTKQNVVEVELSGTDLRYHLNGDDPADWGYWTGISITPPEGKYVTKMKAIGSLSPEGVDTAFANAERTSVQNLYPAVNGETTGFVQYIDYSAYPDISTSGLWIKLQWYTDATTPLDEPVYYHVTFAGLKKKTYADNKTDALLNTSGNATTANVKAILAEANETDSNDKKYVYLLKTDASQTVVSGLPDNADLKTVFGTEPGIVDNYMAFTLKDFLPAEATTTIVQKNAALEAYSADDRIEQIDGIWTKTATYNAADDLSVLIKEGDGVIIEKTVDGGKITYYFVNQCEFAASVTP